MSEASYIYQQGWERERERLLALEAVYDPTTRRLLAGCGLTAGSRCLEVGAGAGGVARWLAEQVGSGGLVVATDLDTRFVEAEGLPQLEIRRHDVVRDELEAAGFDLVHARAVLEHVNSPAAALDRMLYALKPGGWLLVEDLDMSESMTRARTRYVYTAELSPSISRREEAFTALFIRGGSDPEFASRLPGLLLERQLEEVGAEVHCSLTRTGQAGARVAELSLEHMRERLITLGLLNEEEVEQIRQALQESKGGWLTHAMVSAWGRKPAHT